MNRESLKSHIKRYAMSLGFDLFGVAPLSCDRGAMEACARWLEEGKAASMRPWMERNLESRFAPQKNLPSAQSLIMLGVSYAQRPPDLSKVSGQKEGRIARYALGCDYHAVLFRKLESLAAFISEIVAGRDEKTPEFKLFVDSGPLAEKHFAVQAGLGFIGRNGLLIHPEHGSWFFLAGCLTSLELPPDHPIREGGCGSCEACIKACPGGALSTNGACDARSCLSYWTIETREAFPKKIASAMQDRLFGCDTCQEMCPYNARPLPCRTPEFFPSKNADVIDGSNATLAILSELDSNRKFMQKLARSPLSRMRKKGLVRNLRTVSTYLGREDVLSNLDGDAGDEEKGLP